MAAEIHVEIEAPQENEQKQKRKLQSTVLDCFSKLVKDKDAIRIKSGMVLMKHLTINKETDNGVNELKYSLGRLIRGVGSTKNTTRAGFYTTLSTILQTSMVDVEQVLELAAKELHTSGSNSKSENADILTGNILVCGAVLRSQIFINASTENQQKVVQLLLTCAKKKSYLTLLAYTFLVESIEMLTEKQFKKIMLPLIEVEITKSLDAYTLDNLYLLIKIEAKFPQTINSEFLQRIMQRPELISEDTIHDLTEILLNVLPIKHILKHPVFELASEKICATNLTSLFIKEIDLGLSKATYMRHSVATLLLTNVVKKSTDYGLLPEIFTDKFLGMTLAHLKTLQSKNDDELQLGVYELFDAIVIALKNDAIKSKIKINVLKRCLLKPGTFIFEKVTRSKLIQQITAGLSIEGVKKLAKLYAKVLLGEENVVNSTEKWLNMDRVYASQLIVKLMAHPTAKGELDWKIEQLKMLCDQGVLKSEQGSNVGNELAASLRVTFFRAMDQKQSKLDDLITVNSQLIHHLDAQLTPDNYQAVLRVAFTEADYTIWKKTIDLVNKLESKKKGHLNPVFRMLFLNMNMQLLNDNKLATDTLNELFSCYERIKKDKKLKKSVDAIDSINGGDEDDDNVQWIEVVVDLFLNLLSHNTHLLRNLICTVFPFLCKDLTETAVHQILSVLDPKSGDNPLTAHESDDSDEESDADANEDDDASESSEDDDEDEAAGSDVEDTLNDKLRQAVSDALGGRGATSDTESVNLDDMSDGECEKLNEALGAAFKQFKPNLGKKSRKQTKDEETLTHFRIRVLDLIEIYLGTEPSMLLCLEIMLPLLQALEFATKDPHQKPLHDRLRACLKKLSCVKKFSTTADVDEQLLHDLLRSLLEKGTKNTIMLQDMGDKIADCCVFIIRCAQYLGNVDETPKKTKKKLKSGINGIVCEVLDTFFKKRDCLTPYVLFKTILNINWEGNIVLVGNLVDFAFDADVRPFRRNQALELMKIFYSNHRLLSTNIDNYKEPLQNVETRLFDGAMLTLSNSEVALKEKYVCALFVLLNVVKNSPIQNDGLEWAKLAEQVREYRSGVTFSKDAKIAYNKLCSCLKVSNIVKMKPKVVKLNTQIDEDEVIEKTAEIKKRNQRMNNAKHKLKKETQLLRMQSLSEGLGSKFAFSDANVNDLKEEEPEMDVSDGEASSGAEDSKQSHKKQNGFAKKSKKRDISNDDEEAPIKKKKVKKSK